MGVSTDAILFYGFCWSDGDVQLFGEDDEGDSKWQDVIYEKRGGKDPWENYPEKEISKLPYAQQRAATDKWSAEHRAELDAMYEAKRAIEAEFGCDIGHHQSGDCPVPYIFVKESELTAWRGYPKQVTSLVVGEDWNEKLRRFVGELGIEPPEGQEPGWWLVSYWG